MKKIIGLDKIKRRVKGANVGTSHLYRPLVIALSLKVAISGLINARIAEAESQFFVALLRSRYVISSPNVLNNSSILCSFASLEHLK